MTGVNILYFMKYSIQSANLIASPAQTPSAWLLVPVLIIAKDRGVHGEHLAPENQLILSR